MTGVCEPVENGVGHDGIGEDAGPVGHGAIGGKDGGARTEAPVNDDEKTFGGDLIEGFEGKVVDDKKIDPEQALSEDRQPILQIGSGQISKELMEAVEGDGEHHSARLMGDGFGKMGLAGAGGTEEEYAFTFLNEPTGGEIFDSLGVDGGIEREVERLQSRLRTQMCLVNEPVDAAGSTGIEFVGEEHGEELAVGKTVGLGFDDAGIEMFADAGKLEEAKLLEKLVAHRGCSCSLMK